MVKPTAQRGGGGYAGEGGTMYLVVALQRSSQKRIGNGKGIPGALLPLGPELPAEEHKQEQRGCVEENREVEKVRVVGKHSRE